MTTLTTLIAESFDLPRPVNVQPISLNDQRCTITGETLTEGYRVLDAISKTTNDFEIFFDPKNSYMSIDAARCFQGSNPKAKPRARMECSKSMAVVDGIAYEPLISDTAAIEQERTWWAQLVRDVWETDRGGECLFILSTDTKTRVWHQPHVRVGRLGVVTPVTIYNPSKAINKTIEVNWPEMLIDLELTERIVSAGFWNKILSTNLFELRKNLGIPIQQIMEWETQLQIMRCKPHFPIIQLIAREREEYRWQPMVMDVQKLSSPKQQQLSLF